MKNFDLNRPGSNNKFSKYNNTSNFRLVSQNEIYEFIKENPEMSEPEIIYYVYGYKRHTYYEKRYADGFRRALKKYNIQRKPGVNKLTGKKAYVYFTKEFMEATLDNFRNKHCKNNQDESLFNDLTNKYPKLLIIDDVVRLSEYINEVMDYSDFSMIPGRFSDDKAEWVKMELKKSTTLKSLLKNFDIVEYENGKLYLVNIDGNVLISLYEKGFNWLDSLEDNLIDKNNKGWSIKTIYRTKPYLLQYIIEDKQDLIEKCNIIWERYTPKIYNYTMDEIKKLLGVDKRDNLIIK